MSSSTVKPFKFKQFTIHQDKCPMKVGTDGVLLGAWAAVEKDKRVLDIGTGSGVVAIMLGQRNEQAIIHGVEVDADAYEQARQNMEKAPWSDRLKPIHSAIQDYARQYQGQYDHIVSNPPFFSGGTFSNNQDRNSVRHTIKLPHGDLLVAVRKLLAPGGKFSLILPLIEGLRFQELARTYKFYCNRITEVRPKADKNVERLLMEFGQVEKPLDKSTLIIQKEARNDWTEAYIALTGAFYLNM